MSENQQEQAERLRQARIAQAKYTYAADAARAMGVEVPTYLGHENGSRGFKNSASRYADFYRVNLEWLLTGRGKQSRTSAAEERAPAIQEVPKISPELETNVAPVNVIPREAPEDLSVPVMGTAECGPDGWTLFNGERIAVVTRPHELRGIPKAYAVLATGESMEPKFHHGDTLYVNPAKRVQPGDFVLVQLVPAQDGEAPRAVAKRLLRRTEKKVVLEQYNPPKTFDLKAAEVISIHKIVLSGSG